MSKKSFILHIDSLDILNDLTNEQCGELFKAINAHHKNEEITLSPLVKVAFSPFKNQFKRDDEKYELTCKRRAEAGSLGGKQKVANLASATNSKQKVANLADSKNKNKNKKDSESKKDNKKIIKRFVHPNEKQINDYAREGNLNLTGFFDYYTGNGWRVGRNAMKDWQATARNWSRNQYKQVQGRQTKDFNKTVYPKTLKGFDS